MIELALHTLIASACCFGIHEITRPEMIGEKISEWLVLLFGDFYSKPLTECVTCMASVWGTVYYLSIVQVFVDHPHPVRLWLVFILAVAGINAIISNVIYKQ